MMAADAKSKNKQFTIQATPYLQLHPDRGWLVIHCQRWQSRLNLQSPRPQILDAQERWETASVKIYVPKVTANFDLVNHTG